MTCPVCGARAVPDLDTHLERSEECLIAIEMGLVDEEQ
jgi:hypothetical protein